MTTSDLDPDALEKALIAASTIGHIPNADYGRRIGNVWINSAEEKRIRVAITAYLTAREPGVTGKGEGEK